MSVEEYSRYTLLSGSNSSSWSLDKRTVILISVLTFPVFMFCITYMTLLGVYEKVVYPIRNLEEIRQQNVHRALAYNTFGDETNTSYSFYLNSKRYSADIGEFKLVCYYNFPSRPDSLQTEDIDPFLCTHINVGFVEVVNNSIFLSADKQALLKELVKLKTFNAKLKILLSVGGAGGATGFSEMVINHANRKSFIQSVINYVKDYHIDGIDLDWEFPNEDPGNDKYQKMHFTQLLEEMRTCVQRQPKYAFLVSVAVAATSNIISNSYDVSYMNSYVDYINLMAYDYHYYTKYTPFTGINSPLYASESEKYYLGTLNTNYSANYWHFLGMDKSKIIVGLPTYAHTFTLTNFRNNGLYAPASGFGKLGSLGFAGYPQICQFLSTNQISPIFDMESKSPYAVKLSEWVSFEDAESLTYKTEYIRDNKFGGAMVYCLNSDDYKGICKANGKTGIRFPLTNVVKQILMDNDGSG
ncbi:hypothetical protein NQ317_017799 [Molorchus minor]|uniref:GH18 domain-containing protein n=1 Tax=Molorchus minor TaxID=1323400 RepID=A0ABQ9K196_9CUCU|nr:hypothetical protein NQ317_017799 [Molorchus minor]